MRLSDIDVRFPKAYEILLTIMDGVSIPHSAIEDLSHETLRCVDAGLIPAPDLRDLLKFKRDRERRR